MKLPEYRHCELSPVECEPDGRHTQQRAQRGGERRETEQQQTMTESEKAQLGQLYNANHDPQLLNRRTWAKNLCMDYNQLRWGEGVKRTALLQELLGICGEDAVIEPPFFVDYGKNICIGRSFYANLFRVYAPEAANVSVMGEFNGWDREADYMTRDEQGIWEKFIPIIQSMMNTRKPSP